MSSTSDVAALCEQIRSHHRIRTFVMQQRIAIDHSCGAFLRRAMGWSLEAPAAERKCIEAEAAALMEAGRKVASGRAPAALPDLWDDFGFIILGTRESARIWEKMEREHTRAMEAMAMQIPLWTGFAADVRGLGARSLAVLIGEAGDPADYASEAALWKRMGLAVLEGKRQGAPGAHATAEAWSVHGYNPRRRAVMHVIGDVLVRQQGRYREIYLARKAIEAAKAKAAGLDVRPAAKIRKSEAGSCMSEGHVHKRALRYMEKRLLRHLWKAARRLRDQPMADGMGHTLCAAQAANGALPIPTFSEAAE